MKLIKLRYIAAFIVTLALMTRCAMAQTVPASVVLLKDGSGNCTGVVFDSRGYIFTAEHCHFESGTATFPDGKKVRVKRVYDPKRDGIDQAAILKTVDDGPYYYSKMSSSLQIGDEVYSWGYPSGKLSYNKGSITRLSGTTVYVDYYILPGNSGGPLFNVNNEIVGLASRTADPLRSPKAESLWIHISSGMDAIDDMTGKNLTRPEAVQKKPILYIFGTST